MAQTANADQAEFWNTEPGRNWVTHQPDLDVFFAGVNDLLLAACVAEKGERALDVGSGAGASSFALADAVGPAGSVLGVDISAPLVASAEARRAAAGIANVAFVRADAQRHPFEAGAFDLVASRFGLMFFADPVAAFRNLGAALRPGGRIAFAAWAGPEVNPWFALPQRIAVARLGLVEPTPPGAPGPMAFSDIDRVCGILRDAGFAQARGVREATTLHHPGGVAAMLRLAPHVGPMARVLRERDGTADDARAILEGVATEMRRFEAADGVRIPAGVNIFTARLP